MPAEYGLAEYGISEYGVVAVDEPLAPVESVPYPLFRPEMPDPVGLVTPKSSRSRTGPIIPYIWGPAGEVVDDAWKFEKGLGGSGTAIDISFGAPVASIYVRHRENGLTYVDRLHFVDGVANLGSLAIAVGDAQSVIIQTTGGDFDLLGVVGYERGLDVEEFAWLSSLDHWSWGVLAHEFAFASFQSSVYILDPYIVTADRENGLQGDITRHITHAAVDADIDRAGPKGQIALTSTRPDIVAVNTWVAPFQRVIPERGDIIDVQMGLYQLGEPSTRYEGVDVMSSQSDGEDPVALLERSVLTMAETTPVGANVMHEVEKAIQLATFSSVGPNVMSDPSFEATTSLWVSYVNGGGTSTSAVYEPEVAVHGKKMVKMIFPAGSTPAQSRYLLINAPQPLPDGAQAIYASAWTKVDYASALRTQLSFRFMDSGGAYLGTETWRAEEIPYISNQLFRLSVHAPVPENATQFRLILYTIPNTTTGGTANAWFDDVRVMAVAGQPILRHALPPSDKIATSAINHPAGTSWLKRINDLLAAIGHHALYAMPDGAYTSRPLRDPRTDTPVRTYTFGVDSRLISHVETKSATGNIHNVVVAIKEDMTTKTVMTAVARNDDPDHPWSTVNRGIIGKTIVSSDAVDQAALQALVDAEMARVSMQEELTFAVLPDPTLAVHDVIEITNTDTAARGRWAVENIQWGLTWDDPLVQVSARRTLTGKDLIT